MYEYIIKFTHQELPGQQIYSEQWLDVGSLLEINLEKGRVIASVSVVSKRFSSEFKNYDTILEVDLLQYIWNQNSNIKRFDLPEKFQLQQKKMFN
ncbi:hypothetical protein [Lyngbya sp. PCC 8106]|uniref:hypothetical protein n=1 Tax=Lyngbya sp. (strain PCC 8106) TaxID=313612 RepID=UPI0000EA89B0|nr:hypothetical protein [Lyngbya sp. PCC 8106]EAW37282.1 hypothetical protein L8106_11417 [Lyngbya sp. PCC 8106]